MLLEENGQIVGVARCPEINPKCFIQQLITDLKVAFNEV